MATAKPIERNGASDILARFCLGVTAKMSVTEEAVSGRRSLIDFCLRAGEGFWESAKHLELLAEYLEKVERGEITRLIVSMPPRHGKSQMVSQFYPVRYLGRNPDRRVMLTSYAVELARDFGRKCRNLMDELGPGLFGVRVAGDSSAAERWDIEGHRGGLIAAGVGGPITGRGAHLAIIDDPFKNQDEANSPTIRERVWDWYRSTLRTRLAKGGAIVLVMTRWHEDDLAGRLLKAAKDGTGENWVELRLPAEAEENDNLGRAPGEALWPAMFPAESLADIRKALGSYIYAALYQQRPQPMGGSLFKRTFFRYYEEDDDFYILYKQDGDRTTQHRVKKPDCTIKTYVDTAQKTGEKNDFFVASTWAITPEKDAILLDVFRTKLEGPDQPPHIRNIYHRYHGVIGIEDKSAGSTLIQTLQREGLPIRAVKVDTDKVSRALPYAARCEAGTVYHRRGASWLEAWEEEHIAFPNGAHDDQVDTGSMMAADLTNGGRSRIHILD